MIPSRNPSPTDVSDEKWTFVAPDVILLPEDAGQRTHSLHEAFNGLRWIARAGSLWSMMPNDLFSRCVVFQQTRRWITAGYKTALVEDLCLLLQEARGHNRQPSVAILNSRTLQSTPESGSDAGYDGAKRRQGSNVHAAVGMQGNVLTLQVTPANGQDRTRVSELAQALQEVTGCHGAFAFVDQGSPGDVPAEMAKEHNIRVDVVTLPEAKRGFVLLPRRRVVERSCA